MQVELREIHPEVMRDSPAPELQHFMFSICDMVHEHVRAGSPGAQQAADSAPGMRGPADELWDMHREARREQLKEVRDKDEMLQRSKALAPRAYQDVRSEHTRAVLRHGAPAIR